MSKVGYFGQIGTELPKFQSASGISATTDILVRGQCRNVCYVTQGETELYVVAYMYEKIFFHERLAGFVSDLVLGSHLCERPRELKLY